MGMAEAVSRNNVLGADPAKDGPKPKLLHSPGALANLRRKIKTMRRIKSKDARQETMKRIKVKTHTTQRPGLKHSIT
jgi:hypothetical protein